MTRGVRIAAGVVQGIAFAAQLPVVAVSTLATLAAGAMRETGYACIMAALDARMAEVYWGVYRQAQDGLSRLQGVSPLCPIQTETTRPPTSRKTPD